MALPKKFPLGIVLTALSSVWQVCGHLSTLQSLAVWVKTALKLDLNVIISVLQMIGFALITWAVVDLSRKSVTTTTHSPPIATNDLHLVGSVSPLLRRPANESGAAPLLQTVTSGMGEQELKFKQRPRKVLFEQPRAIVTENNFGTRVTINGKDLKILRFTDAGVVVDDQGARLDVSVYLLDT